MRKTYIPIRSASLLTIILSFLAIRNSNRSPQYPNRFGAESNKLEFIEHATLQKPWARGDLVRNKFSTQFQQLYIEVANAIQLNKVVDNFSSYLNRSSWTPLKPFFFSLSLEFEVYIQPETRSARVGRRFQPTVWRRRKFVCDWVVPLVLLWSTRWLRWFFYILLWFRQRSKNYGVNVSEPVFD